MKVKPRFWLVAGVILFFVLDEGSLQLLSMLLYVVLIVIDDFRGFKLRRFDISTAFAALLFLTCISHALAFFGLSDNPWFFRDVYSPLMANKAIFIFNLGSICMMEAMRRIVKYDLEKEDKVLAEIANRFSFGYIFIFSVILFLLAANFKPLIMSLGSFGAFILMIINGSVLLLSFIANSKNKNVPVVVAYTIFLSLWALQFSYLRMEILIPIVAYLGGDILANRSVKKMHFFSKALIVGGLVIFPPLFTFLGENRAKIYGANKLDASLELFENEQNDDGQSVMSRMSIIPQLSKIVMLTEKKGFYNGQTLNYLGYVFIPRFIWPEKPVIMQGQWFALEIGAAYKKKDGKANNSVNMTVPGEFYLNFSWPGVIIGCTLFGLFIGWIWNRTSYSTMLGWAFRFYFIFLGLFSLGADLQIIPKLIAYMLLYTLLVYLIPKSNQATLKPATNPPLHG